MSSSRPDVAPAPSTQVGQRLCANTFMGCVRVSRRQAENHYCKLQNFALAGEKIQPCSPQRHFGPLTGPDRSRKRWVESYRVAESETPPCGSTWPREMKCSGHAADARFTSGVHLRRQSRGGEPRKVCVRLIKLHAHFTRPHSAMLISAAAALHRK